MATRQSIKVPRTCETCQTIFYVYPSTLRYDVCRFCSRQCRRRMVQRTCDECGRIFTAPPYRFRGDHSFCSTACNYTHRTTDIQTRFWRYVGPPDENGCHLWTGARAKAGYGRIGTGGHRGGHVGSHRIAWEIANGPIPDGLWVLHKCDNPPCVNPDHLFLGTLADNQADMRAKGRHIKGEACTRSALTPSLVIEVRRLHRSEGMKHVDIARHLGVSAQAIRNVLSGKTWKHI